eukprot:gene778-10507_t
MKWLDRRLMFSNTTDDDVIALQGDATKFFWRPDIFFDGEKGVKQDTFPGQQTSAWIYPDGHIIYTTRVSITVYCPMDFKMFPFDKQICSLRIESWSFNMDSVTLEYFNSTDNSGVSLSDSFRLAKFLLERIEALKFSMDYGISGIFDQLKVVFYLKRDIRFYLMEYYFPIICLVFLSFVSFWIHFKATPARVALPVTTFLTLTKMVAHVRVNMDIYGTAHALETFLNISVLFVFGVIFQFAIVGVTAISWSKKKQRRRIAVNNIGVEADGQPASRKKGIFGILDKTRDFLVAKHRTMEYEVHLLDKLRHLCLACASLVPECNVFAECAQVAVLNVPIIDANYTLSVPIRTIVLLKPIVQVSLQD